MQLIVPFAGALSDAGRHAAQSLSLPHLEQLLARWHAQAALGSDEHSMSAPHELALARSLGWPLVDGRLPWAALAARRDGLDLGWQAIGEVTPVHLHVGTDQVTLTDPAALQLGDTDARALFAALQPLFAGAGFALHWGDAWRWYVAHESLGELATASLDRVIGRHIDPWLPDPRASRPWQRLLSEAQMLLYTHAANERREGAGLPIVNSLWLSGCGVAAEVRGEPPQVDASLRAAALNEDWVAWLDAWRALDAGPIAALLERRDEAALTLAGERRALTFVRGAASPWQRLRAAWRRAEVQPLLDSL